MDDYELKILRKQIKPNDPVYLENKFGIFSTIKNDPLSWNLPPKNLIYCAGKIIDFEQNVFNFQKNEIVGYLSYIQDLNTTLSSNLIFKLEEKNTNLISILPYASYAMKIIRKIDPKLGENIVLIGFNFFSLLLFKLIKLSGANVFIMKFNEDIIKYEYNNEVKNYIIGDINNIKKFFKNIKIKNIIQISEFNEEIKNFLKKTFPIFYKKLYLIGLHNINSFKLKEEFEVNIISPFDVGYDDLNYIRGIKYPYSYIRWDYMRNLKYFIYLVEKEIIKIDFLDFIEIEVNSIEEVREKIYKIQEEAIFLFQIHN